MRRRLFGLVLVLAAAARAQPQACSCGANPPGPPAARTLAPYGGVPEDLRPFSHFTQPYYEHYTKEVEYNGAARDARTLKPSDVSEVAIGFLGPVREHKD